MEKIQVSLDINLDHYFFNHLDEKTRAEIQDEMKKEKSHAVLFRKNDSPFMAAIVSVTNKGIHLREMGGAFVWGMRHVEVYCNLLAEKLDKKYITFRSKIEAVKAVGVRLGYIPFYVHDDNSVDYEKELSYGR